MNRLEWENPYCKRRLAMKNKWLARAAAIALGLFLATWFPASVAADPDSESCQTLKKLDADALKPASVTVVEYTGGSDALLSWTLASNAPSDAFDGWCVKKSNVSSGKQRAECFSQIGITMARFNSCVGVNDCPTGKFNFYVKLENNCGLSEPWSDAVAYEFSDD